MSTITQEIEQVIKQLVTEKKQPSVALIKARLTTSLPIPVIIKALQAWQKNAKVPHIEKQHRVLTAEQRIEQLEQQVLALSTRLARLEADR
ncbi:hypothetical protein C0Z01_16030 [Photobacterium kishitanii]|uniref:KfrA N-terminal DNA-binding domain-containing protein n=1 Tax=Photobacterium kishitanii TaxID=318456 RepID=A0A2T3KDZ6_9GAMM|nr:hypothetical protein [Photobacterium kishitanii]KJG07325.1 hypothetical protein UB40_19325 [Photobacterium kishitanii]KJG55582.1 hypothetical protein UA38_19105 [Photobacterium kishitanii]KJG67083.1 hypothetical protein UA41_19855 [Photobacterium kishitanii]OBU26308.1 hypothetical protein AYY22_18505 [Photobacterium kishitanii]PSU19664.1 hypothetical protein CTM84_15620 [Photobacterium kishitanii]